MKQINTLFFALFLLFIGFKPLYSISVNKVRTPTTRVRIVNLLSGFCVTYDDRRFNFPLDSNTFCDHLENRVHWELENSTDGGYYFKNVEYNKYLRDQGNGKGALGDKFSLKLDYISEKQFRIYYTKNNLNYCYDSTTQVDTYNTFRECNAENKNQVAFLYQFDTTPFNPIVETDVFYILFWFDGYMRRGFRPVDIKKHDGLNDNEASDYDVTNHYKFVAHPTQKGVYQIVNKDGSAFQAKFSYSGPGPYQIPSYNGMWNMKQSDPNNNEQYFRLVRSPLSPNYFYLRSNSYPQFVIINGGGASQIPIKDLPEYHYSVEKICDTPTVRENVWYQIKMDFTCVSANPQADAASYGNCALNDNFFWKLNWDERLNGYKITHKASGKIATVDDVYNGIIRLVNGDPKTINARWIPTDHDNIFPLKFKLRNRYLPYCFLYQLGTCTARDTFIELNQAVFNLSHEDPLGNGYMDVCGWDNKSPFFLNTPLV